MNNSQSKIIKAITDEAILSAVLNLPHERLIAHAEDALGKNLSPKQRRQISKMQEQITSGQPLAYVLGEKWFYGHRFEVNKNVLIPRPETELLVDYAIAEIKKGKPAAIYDIGCGSGAIAVSIAEAMDSKVIAVDISAKALLVAKKNAKAILNKKSALVKFIKSDLLQKISSIPTNSLVCANLPYLSKSELKESTISKEPKLALYGAYKKDLSATAVINSLLQQATKKRKGQLTVILEMNYNQAKKITALAKRFFPDSKVEIVKDYSNFDRIVIIRTK